MKRIFINSVMVFMVVGCGSNMSIGKDAACIKKGGGNGLQNRVIGEYIVTVKENGSEIKEKLEKIFAEFTVAKVEFLTDKQYLVTIKNDPGPDFIEKKVSGSSFITAVQPNFIYRASPEKIGGPKVY